MFSDPAWYILAISITLIFVGVYGGCVLLFYAARARNWQRVPATLEGLNTVEVSSSESLGTKWEQRRRRHIFASYRYTYRGQEYVGNAVNALDHVPFLINYDEALYQHLSRLSNGGAELTVWVNPHNPSQALISNRLYPVRLLFQLVLLAFGVIGIWLTVLLEDPKRTDFLIGIPLSALFTMLAMKFKRRTIKRHV